MRGPTWHWKRAPLLEETVVITVMAGHVEVPRRVCPLRPRRGGDELAELSRLEGRGPSSEGHRRSVSTTTGRGLQGAPIAAVIAVSSARK